MYSDAEYVLENSSFGKSCSSNGLSCRRTFGPLTGSGEQTGLDLECSSFVKRVIRQAPE